MEGSRRNIPVKMGDFSIIDTEFSSIRERFDAEMRKMEDEMSKFRSELISRESPFSQSSITSRTHTSEYHRVIDGREEQREREILESFSRNVRPEPTAPQPSQKGATQAAHPAASGRKRSGTSTSTQSSSSPAGMQPPGFATSSLAPRSDPKTWLENLNSPLIQDEGDQKQLKLRFDVSQYKPEEIVVKTVDNKLLVHAKHEEKTDSRSVYREYNREFLLPQGSNPEMIKSSLSKDGILTVEAPLPELQGTGHISIAHK